MLYFNTSMLASQLQISNKLSSWTLPNDRPLDGITP